MKSNSFLIVLPTQVKLVITSFCSILQYISKYMALIKNVTILLLCISFYPGIYAQNTSSFIEFSPPSPDIAKSIGSIGNFHYYQKSTNKTPTFIKTDSLFNQLASVSFNAETDAGKFFYGKAWNNSILAFYFKVSKSGIAVSYQAFDQIRLEKKGGLIKLTEFGGMIVPDIEKHFSFAFSANSNFFILVSNIKKKKTDPSYLNACIVDSTMKVIRQEEFPHDEKVLTSPQVFVFISNNGSAAITAVFGEPNKGRDYIIHCLPANNQSFSRKLTSDGLVSSDARAICTSNGNLIVISTKDPSKENRFSKTFYQIYNSNNTLVSANVFSFSDSLGQFRCANLLLDEDNQKVFVIGKVITIASWPEKIPPRSISVSEISLNKGSNISTIIYAGINETADFLSGMSTIYSSFEGNSLHLLYNSSIYDNRYLYYSNCKFENDSCSITSFELYKYPHPAQAFVYPEMSEFNGSDIFTTYWILVKPFADLVIANKVFIKISH